MKAQPMRIKSIFSMNSEAVGICQQSLQINFFGPQSNSNGLGTLNSAALWYPGLKEEIYSKARKFNLFLQLGDKFF
jgi:hypothetical protein